MFGTNVFESMTGIPTDTQIVFVADMFASDYVGGAELTSQALIDSSPLNVHCIKSRNLTMEHLRQGTDKFWIFGNFAELNYQLVPSIVSNLKYSILEYDYKYCRYRSAEKHKSITKTDCDCHEQSNGKLTSAFMYGASCLFWMSEKQKEKYHSVFPFLAEKDNYVLSSVFSAQTLAYIEHLKLKSPAKNGWIVLGSSSWVKGASEAEAWCKFNKVDYSVVWNLPYNKLLQKLASAEGFVYLPAGSDTCPRMVIEAKLLGCKLVLNENVQHKNEEWFDTDNLEEIKAYLFNSPALFWNVIKSAMNYKPTISGYTTTYNCLKQTYPFEQCIRSMLHFCDEVCVVDGGSTDGTLDILSSLQTEFGSKVKVKIIARDWSYKYSSVFDGQQKAEARAMCSSKFCWQMDSDEVVHEDDGPKIVDLCRKFPAGISIISLPVIEYWGSSEKVRVDVSPWKWRLSKNLESITHGIPGHLRRYDSDGSMYAATGTDGCDMIDKNSLQQLQHISFYTQEAENARVAGLNGNIVALKAYEKWYNEVVSQLPGVFHYSWYDLPRKIRLYRDFWTSHWERLEGKKYVDTAESNMFFDVPWSQVTEEMILQRAKELNQIGGWIWHRKWNGFKTPWIKCTKSQPRFMIEANEKAPHSG